MPPSEASRAFEAMKPELLRAFRGQFALVCGERLMGVFSSLDEAVDATSRLFEADDLPPGAPVLISEIAVRASVRVTATPYRRARQPVATAG